MVSALLTGMAMVLTKVGPGTPLGQAVAKAITDIGKHVPPGASTPQGDSNQIKAMAMRQAQMAPHQAAVGAQGAPPSGAAMPPKPLAPPAAPSGGQA